MRRIALPAYLVAALLFFLPLVDTALSVWPLRGGQVAWRFGAAGLFSRALLTPLLGMLFTFAVALLLEQRRVVRALAVLSALGAVLLVGLSGVFALDALQMRAQVAPQAKLAFDVTTVVALGKYLLGLVVALAFAVSGWKASRRERGAARGQAREEAPAPGLVMRRPAAASRA